MDAKTERDLSRGRANPAHSLDESSFSVDEVMRKAMRAAANSNQPEFQQANMFGRDAADSHPVVRNMDDGEYWRLQEELMGTGILQPAYYTPEARARLACVIEEILPRTGTVIDLMSGAESNFHRLPGRRTIGMGAGKDSMRNNPVLDEAVVIDLNRNPELPYNGRAGAAVMSAGIMYLTSPIEVLKSVRSHLTPGGMLVVSYSTLNFDSVMSVNVWNDPARWGFADHADVLKYYLREAGWQEMLNVRKDDDLVVASIAAAAAPVQEKVSLRTV